MAFSQIHCACIKVFNPPEAHMENWRFFGSFRFAFFEEYKKTMTKITSKEPRIESSK